MSLHTLYRGENQNQNQKKPPCWFSRKKDFADIYGSKAGGKTYKWCVYDPNIFFITSNYYDVFTPQNIEEWGGNKDQLFQLVYIRDGVLYRNSDGDKDQLYEDFLRWWIFKNPDYDGVETDGKTHHQEIFFPTLRETEDGYVTHRGTSFKKGCRVSLGSQKPLKKKRPPREIKKPSCARRFSFEKEIKPFGKRHSPSQLRGSPLKKRLENVTPTSYDGDDTTRRILL